MPSFRSSCLIFFAILSYHLGLGRTSALEADDEQSETFSTNISSLNEQMVMPLYIDIFIKDSNNWVPYSSIWLANIDHNITIPCS